MKNYYLFLDESKPNGSNINHLCLAGIIINQDTYEKEVVKEVKALKNKVFGNTDIVLHESDLRKAQGEYTIMRVQEKREEFWEEMKKIFSNFPITTIGASIHLNDYKTFYQDNHLNNEYYIVLQIALENFVHFLRQNNSIGSVYIESTNPSDDSKLRNLYHKIIANGTLYFSPNAFQEKLSNINFLIKADNNIGLQLADFIPGTLNRSCNGLAPKQPSIYDLIESNLYDGRKNLPNRFGFKVLP